MSDGWVRWVGKASKSTMSPWADFVGALVSAGALAAAPNATRAGIVIMGANSTAPPPTREG